MRVETITGLESIKIVFNDIIKTGKEVVGWGATDRAAQLLPKFTREYIKQREDKGITARQLYVEDGSKLETSISKWKKVPKEFSMPATTLIYGNRVALMMWFSKPILAILIKNKEISQAYRNHFEYLWKTRVFTIDEIIKTESINNLTKALFNKSKYKLVDRQKFWIIKKVKEANNKITRIILLPPSIKTAFDFTGIKEFNLMSPHPEMEEATIEIKGGVVPGNSSFSKIKATLKICYYVKKDVKVGQKKFYEEKLKSSHEPKFKVVKSNGWGFYHNLINRSNEWLVVVLEAKLHPVKQINFKDKLNKFTQKEKQLVKNLISKIEIKGDYIFKEETALINQVLKLDAEKIIPVLIESLNFKNQGHHESCTAFALLLKLGRKYPHKIKKYINEALKNKLAPEYYLKQLKLKFAKK